jgi:hypothetical protein
MEGAEDSVRRTTLAGKTFVLTGRCPISVAKKRAERIQAPAAR